MFSLFSSSFLFMQDRHIWTRRAVWTPQQWGRGEPSAVWRQAFFVCVCVCVCVCAYALPAARLQCDIGSAHQMTDSELSTRTCVNLHAHFKWTVTVCVCVCVCVSGGVLSGWAAVSCSTQWAAAPAQWLATGQNPNRDITVQTECGGKKWEGL